MDNNNHVAPKGRSNFAAPPVASLYHGVRLTSQLGLAAAMAFAAEEPRVSSNPNPKSLAKEEKEATTTVQANDASSLARQFEDADDEEEETRIDKNTCDSSTSKRASENVPSLPLKKRKTALSDTSDTSQDQVITKVLQHDVLFGRGGNTNRHPGNIEYRNLVKSQQLRYMEAHRLHKGEIAREIVQTIRSRGGRFLKQNDPAKILYEDVGDALAKAKTSQALREGLNQRLFFQTQRDGQLMPHLSTLDEKSQDAVCQLFRLEPKKRRTFSYEQERQLIHPIDCNDGNAIIPNNADVIYGKGMAIQQHPGNVRFRNIVNMHRSKYQACFRKKEKAAISNDIMRIIHASGGRFLLYENGQYTEVSARRAKEKVSHALRNRRPYANTTKELLQQQQNAFPSSGSIPTLPKVVFPVSPPYYGLASSFEAV